MAPVQQTKRKKHFFVACKPKNGFHVLVLFLNEKK